MSFIDKMVNLGWTTDGRFEDDNETLTRAVVRYHAFLDLMSSQAGSFIVPTLVSQKLLRCPSTSLTIILIALC